ncbi:MAG TPA: MBL fold metallo-hydrolase [Polyangia bacterium]|nr:MBL fold metallo-hydrolase [Polyangia bacterium]
MRVTFYGVRGSVPTPGASTVRYGGNTSCIETRLADGTILILDGGTGLRELGKQLVAEGVKAPLHLMITHVHWDHIIGVPFFAPIYTRDTQLILYPLTTESPASPLPQDELFDGLHFPLRMHQLPSQIVRPPAPASDGSWRVGSARVTRVRLNHPGGSTGFRVDDADGSSLAFLTDNELDPPGGRLISTAELARFAKNAGLLVHDAQYLDGELPDKRGWGHSTVPQVLELGRMAEARRVALYHHDPERDDDALDEIARGAHAWWRENVGAGDAVVAAEKLSIEVPPG